MRNRNSMLKMLAAVTIGFFFTLQLNAQAMIEHFETLKTMPGGKDLKPMSELKKSGGRNVFNDAPVLTTLPETQVSIETPANGKRTGNEIGVFSAIKTTSVKNRTVEKHDRGIKLKKQWQLLDKRMRKFFHHKKCKTCPDW